MRRFFLFLGLALIILIGGFYVFILKHEVRSADFLTDNARAIAAIQKKIPSRYLVLMDILLVDITLL